MILKRSYAYSIAAFVVFLWSFTLPMSTPASYWILVYALMFVFLGLGRFFERRELSRSKRSTGIAAYMLVAILLLFILGSILPILF